MTILLGDCRELLPISCDTIITDPPYGVDKHGNMIGQISSNYHEAGAHSRGYKDHNRGKFVELLQPAFDGMIKSLPAGGTMVAFCGNRTFAQMVSIAESVGFEMLDIVVMLGGGSFAKSFSTLAPRHELMMIARKPGAVRDINPTRGITNVWNIPKGKSESEHPTTKPQAWMEQVVKVFSSPHHVILDPFAGSGSTGVAAQKLGRKFVGIESVEEYYRIAEKRLA